MKWIEAKVVFYHTDKDLAADLIASIFCEFDLQGVVIEDPDLAPENGWGEDAVARPGGHAVIGYFSKDRRIETKCKILADKIGQLKNTLGLTYRISYKELDEEDWAEAWKAFFWPQKIGRLMVVKPTWRDYQAHPDDIVVELDPGMAFGTGTHPTTALCIEMMETYFRDGDTFLDLGTGSGILMIAAAKLGAGRVCGIDKDDIAVEIAQKNLMLNKIDRKFFSVHSGNLVEGIEKKYDFIAANILTHVIIDLLDDIQRVIKEKGVFVCSGILEENKDLVVTKMKDIGFEILEDASKEHWVAIAGRFKVQGSGFRVKGRTL
jgi:ribosomal protein L11 methyltransferase